jgi:DNA polymerase-3 subunit gamma/tau
MDNYIVSALKYRPATFESVVGQKALATTLKNAILTNKLAHAYLFCGPRGVGKTTCARIFAKTINCTNLNAEGEACNECESCRSFNEQRSLNIYELDAASNNSVDDIRTLIEQVRIPPQSGKYKVYIIDEVHMLSTAAFNAFLKTLEEPPHYVIFILATTEKHKVLPTILSRCQIYDFNRIGVKDIVDYLAYVAGKENVKADTDALNIIAMKADGGMRDALSIFDQAISFTGGNITYQSIIDNLNVLDYEYYFRLTDYLLENKVSDSLLLLNEILNKGFEGSRFIGGLATHFRDLLVSHDPATVQLLEVGDNIRKRYIAQAQNCQIKFLYRAIKLCNDCDLNYRTSRNKRLLVELTLIELAQITEEDVPESAQPAVASTYNHHTPVRQNTVAQSPVPPVPPVAPIPTPDVQEAVPLERKQGPMSELLKTKSQRQAKVPVVSFDQLGVSIKGDKISESDLPEQTLSGNEDSIGNDPFDESQINLQLRRFAETLPLEHKALSLQMQNFKAHLTSPSLFEIIVDNDFAAKELDRVKGNLMSFLRRELNNAQIEMSICVSASEENNKPIGRREKFQYMAQKNNALNELQQAFGLELS